jgi:hypothetical protein
MYSKTRNTLTALTAAALFVVGGWLLGKPAAHSEAEPYALPAAVAESNANVQLVVAGNVPSTPDAHAVATLRSRHANRMNLSMPYFSFVQVLPQRRAD